MKNYQKNIIGMESDLFEALRAINEVPKTLTLFVVSEDGKLMGTLTDGDIRRGLLSGLSVNASVTKVMTSKFKAINSGYSATEFKSYREAGIRLLPELDNQGKIAKIFDLRVQKCNLPVECVIMAGGRGERLRPLTDSTPKPMLMIGGKPIIEHNIDRLISHGIEKIYISVRYLGQQIIDYFGDGSSKGISIEYIWEDQPMGTAGSLSQLVSVKSDYLLIMNSDLYTDCDFEDLYLSTLASHADIGIASVAHIEKIPFGIFEMKGRYVKSIIEKPTYTRYANAGIYLFNTELLKYIPKNSYYDIPDLLNLVIQKNKLIVHSPIIGYWIDIGQHQDYENAKQILKHIRT